jgi:trans-aconitate methyltransferase
MKFDRAYFDDIYAKELDPWGLQAHFYEARKRALLMAALPGARYEKAFEPACGPGLLTQQLAGRCTELLATDVSEAAVRSTAQRLREASHVAVRRMQVPAEWPDERFDLIVFSEFIYYLASDERELLALQARESLMEGGTVVACHWNRRIDAAIPLAQALHSELGEVLGWPCLVHHQEPDFILHVWAEDGRSVAVREGIIAG